jgi:hypothetical protein
MGSGSYLCCEAKIKILPCGSVWRFVEYSKRGGYSISITKDEAGLRLPMEMKTDSFEESHQITDVKHHEKQRQNKSENLVFQHKGFILKNMYSYLKYAPGVISKRA